MDSRLVFKPHFPKQWPRGCSEVYTLQCALDNSHHSCSHAWGEVSGGRGTLHRPRALTVQPSPHLFNKA
jgi:hypothetical protein